MWNWITKLEELRTQGEAVVSVTVTQSSGSTPREAGAKMLVLADGRFFGTIGGGRLEQLALEDAQKCFRDKKSKTIRYPLGAKTAQCCGGVIELFFEVLNTGPSLYLFGAGHVGQAVCRILDGTPFQVHLIDPRAEWINSSELPASTIRRHGDWDDFAKDLHWDSSTTYAVVMAHLHDLDQQIIEYAMSKQARYLGLIGSAAKWARFKQRYRAKGIEEGTMNRVRCPVGLALGGKAPQEIAISVAAELLKVHYDGVDFKTAHVDSSRRRRCDENEGPQGPLEIS